MADKIDLDALEQRAGHDLAEYQKLKQTWPALFRAQDTRPVTHAVTLALIARIRELETKLQELVDTAEFLRHPAVEIAVCDLLEKGAVLP